MPLPLKNSLGLLGALGPAGQPLQLQSSRPGSKDHERDHGGSIKLWLSLFSQMRQACRAQLMLPSLAAWVRRQAGRWFNSLPFSTMGAFIIVF